MDLTINSSKVVVFGGLAKTGTTLPLTLLDGHTQLTVFPEELRFFHLELDTLDPDDAAFCFLNSPHCQLLGEKPSFFDSDDYMAHHGTGFGRRDYTAFNYQLFSESIKKGFQESATSEGRFNTIINAFKLGIGKNPEKDQSIFVCKAPHNEIYSKKWTEMLKQRGLYVITTRLPTEHFISLNNIQHIQKRRVLNPLSHANTVRARAESWDNFPQKNTFFIDYDELLTQSDKVVNDLCSFIGVNREPINNKPTKMSIEWAGNSSRGIVKNEIFSNPHKAQKQLSKKTIIKIEQNLISLYERFGWDFIYHANLTQKLSAQLQRIVWGWAAQVKKFALMLITFCLPRTPKEQIKGIPKQ